MSIYRFTYLGTDYVIDADGIVWKQAETTVVDGVHEYTEFDHTADPAFVQFIENKFA